MAEQYGINMFGTLKLGERLETPMPCSNLIFYLIFACEKKQEMKYYCLGISTKMYTQAKWHRLSPANF